MATAPETAAAMAMTTSMAMTMTMTTALQARRARSSGDGCTGKVRRGCRGEVGELMDGKDESTHSGDWEGP